MPDDFYRPSVQVTNLSKTLFHWLHWEGPIPSRIPLIPVQCHHCLSKWLLRQTYWVYDNQSMPQHVFNRWHIWYWNFSKVPYLCTLLKWRSVYLCFTAAANTEIYKSHILHLMRQPNRAAHRLKLKLALYIITTSKLNPPCWLHCSHDWWFRLPIGMVHVELDCTDRANDMLNWRNKKTYKLLNVICCFCGHCLKYYVTLCGGGLPPRDGVCNAFVKHVVSVATLCTCGALHKCSCASIDNKKVLRSCSTAE